MNQAEDRAHRIGQKNSVNIYYLHGRQTLDDLIFDLINHKSLVTTDITDGRKISLGISKNEI
jgi:SWI/SNF-related matrix-associated actin-dependent regulator 1 of chromatin subfamily A